MKTTANEVLQFVKENDVKFIRLAFCDLFGAQKNISIMANELPEAFANGVSFDASAIRGFRKVTESDLFLYPDPATLTVLPWRPGPGRVIRFSCDIRDPAGLPFAFDTRSVLKKVIEKGERMGYACHLGTECEFYLFKTREDGEPSELPLDYGGYFDLSPLDKGENIRREICLCLEEMGLCPEASHHERGPGQNEIDFKYQDALASADHFLVFKSVVKAIAARNGLFASFMPKPLTDEAGSGLHVNISLTKNGTNIFQHEAEHFPEAAEYFMAGVLEKIREITVFLNPLRNSYDRLGSFEAPRYISWSHQNRSQLIRIPAASGTRMRMELRSPDPSVNPYIAFALILAAGLEGIEKSLSLPPAVNEDLFLDDDRYSQKLDILPANLSEAIEKARESTLAQNILGHDLLSKFLEYKKQEAAESEKAKDKTAFDKKRYFTTI